MSRAGAVFILDTTSRPCPIPHHGAGACSRSLARIQALQDVDLCRSPASQTVFVTTDVSAQTFAAKLRARPDCRSEPGLTADEIRRAEDHFQLAMAPLWREVLSFVHPVELPEPPRGADGIRRWKTRFPDWRLRDIPATQSLISRPVEGVLFDVEQSGFWWRAWGDAPEDIGERIKKARSELVRIPKLTPLWGNLYAANTDDSPVFSIVQTILYIPALTLAGMVRETAQTEDDLPVERFPIGDIPFWSLLHAYSQTGHVTRFDYLVRLIGTA